MGEEEEGEGGANRGRREERSWVELHTDQRPSSLQYQVVTGGQRSAPFTGDINKNPLQPAFLLQPLLFFTGVSSLDRLTPHPFPLKNCLPLLSFSLCYPSILPSALHVLTSVEIKAHLCSLSLSSWHLQEPQGKHEPLATKILLQLFLSCACRWLFDRTCIAWLFFENSSPTGTQKGLKHKEERKCFIK